MHDSAPPLVRRRFLNWRNARRSLLACLGLITLVVAFYVVEGWRGRRAWAEVEELARNRGESLTLADFVSPSVPDADDFATAPIVSAMCSSDEKFATAASERLRLVTAGGGVPKERVDGDLAKARTLGAWRALLGTEDLLAHLDRYASVLDEIAVAARRPSSRYSPRLGRVSWLVRATQLLRLRAEARMERGQASGAANDLVTILGLARGISAESGLLDQLVAAAITERGVQVLRNGYVTGIWSKTELLALDENLARLDLVGGGWRSFRLELAFGTAAIRQVIEQPNGAVSNQVYGDHQSFSANLLLRACPSGWFFQQLASDTLVYLDEFLPAYDAKTRRVNYAPLPAWKERLKYPPLRRVFSPLRLPDVAIFYDQFVAGQTRVDLARTAIALDLWRREHGAYPESLAELPGAAQGVGGLHDLVTGELFHYRKTGATFLLYATGPDGIDNGGGLGTGGDGRPKSGGDDWVW